MATPTKIYPDQVAEFEQNWQRFRWMLDDDEQAHWDVLLERVRRRPYPGQIQLDGTHDDPKWPMVFTMLVTQQAEIARLRERLADGEDETDRSTGSAPRRNSGGEGSSGTSRGQ